MDVTDQTFQAEVLDRSATVPVIVDLWAQWCGPCKTLGPMLEKAVADTGGAVELAKVDVDNNPAVAQAFNVQSIPAVFALVEGQVVDQFIGAVPEAQVTAFVQRLAPAPSEADTLAAAGDEASLRQALELEPDHPAATEGLARILIDRGEPAEALALLARLPETESGRALAAEARLLEAGVDLSGTGRAEMEAKLDELLERVRDDDAARQEFVDLLEAMGPEDPRTKEYRRALTARPVLMAAPATGTPTTDDETNSGACASLLNLGGIDYDLTHRALVMGILNRTPDSFYDKGATFELDKLYARAEQLVADGADILDIGGVKAGPGPEVTEPEELDRVVPVVAGLVARFDTPVSVDTWRASVARASYAEGAVMGNDISGLADPDYAPAAAEHGAAVVITHIRLAPRVADPEPHYDDVVADVARFLTERADGARAAGLPPERIVLDAGLDLGKTAEQSLTLLRASAELAGLGYPLLLSASNKTFLGKIFDLELTERREASIGAAALGIAWGCRIVRVHDVKGTCRARDVLAAMSEAR